MAPEDDIDVYEEEPEAVVAPEDSLKRNWSRKREVVPLQNILFDSS